jgi:hypothetical protein
MPATGEALALRRRRNRDGQARYYARHFGSHGDLARIRADVRIEARAALGRLADHFGISLTELIEELAAGRERAVLAKLRPEQAELYLANDPDLLAHYRSRRRTSDPSTSKNKSPARKHVPGREYRHVDIYYRTGTTCSQTTSPLIESFVAFARAPLGKSCPSFNFAATISLPFVCGCR